MNTTEFQSYSQAGQDKFAFHTSRGNRFGTFLDIGCGHPTAYSNSYGLEQIGWRGLCVDIHEEPDFRQKRQMPLLVGDARKIDWSETLPHYFKPGLIDYLSLDVDEHCFEVLFKLPLNKFAFRAITIEHDNYRLGPRLKELERSYLISHGYTLVCPDVEFEKGKPFEDWWIYESLLCPCTH